MDIQILSAVDDLITRVENRKEMVRNRDKWQDVMMAAKTFNEQTCPKGKYKTKSRPISFMNIRKCNRIEIWPLSGTIWYAIKYIRYHTFYVHHLRATYFSHTFICIYKYTYHKIITKNDEIHPSIKDNFYIGTVRHDMTFCILDAFLIFTNTVGNITTVTSNFPSKPKTVYITIQSYICFC
jgi:hypothetical protein